mgnify:CR=1 FL=1
MKNIVILGSTGSIGENAVNVIRGMRGKFRIVGLSASSNFRKLLQQAEEFGVKHIVVADKNAALACRKVAGRGVDVKSGEKGLVSLVSETNADIVLCSISGMAALMPVVAAVEKGIDVALATKEILVAAGEILVPMAIHRRVNFLPVDSEHSAIFLLLDMLNRSDVRRIILTASGGSLRGKTKDELSMITPAEALAHPTWDMGNKITIDSSTLMNKGLEVIEAHHLFGLSYDQISVIIHPESVVHSLVETLDGAVYAHMGVADMVFPIINALFYPEKRRNPFGRLDLIEHGTLHFFHHDTEAFPALELCYRAGRVGGTCPAVLNAANEECVRAFLEGKISLTRIAETVEKIIDEHDTVQDPGIDDIFQADRWARKRAHDLMNASARQ